MIFLKKFCIFISRSWDIVFKLAMIISKHRVVFKTVAYPLP